MSSNEKQPWYPNLEGKTSHDQDNWRYQVAQSAKLTMDTVYQIQKAHKDQIDALQKQIADLNSKLSKRGI